LQTPAFDSLARRIETISYNQLALELLRHGYEQVLYVEIYCRSCGAWRAPVLWSESRMPCPRCHMERDAVLLGRGFTCHPCEWERVRAPLSPGALGWVLTVEPDDDQRDRRRIRKEQHRGNPRASHYRQEIPPEHFADNPRYA